MEIKYEDIERVNKTIKTTGIKRKDKDGKVFVKDYAEVPQRIKAFRMLYPQGKILTEMLSNQDGVCIFKAAVYDSEDHVLATGTAYEKENSTFINQTSYIENCETSAVGRALGIAGFGIDTSIASVEEVVNAMNNQEEQKATAKQVEILAKNYTGDNLKKLLESNKITKLDEISMKKASELIGKIYGGKNEKENNN